MARGRSSVDDSTLPRHDPRFANNPFVKERGFRFYAGVPLHGPNGLDTKPRELSTQEHKLLKAIAEDVMEDIKRRSVLDDRTPRAAARS